jgi:hypothetical protein
MWANLGKDANLGNYGFEGKFGHIQMLANLGKC